MADDPNMLRRRIAELEEEVQRLRHQTPERELLQAVLATSVSAIVVLDPSGRITYANERAERILGLARLDLLDRRYDAPAWKITDIDGGPWPEERQPFVRVLSTGQPVFDVRHAIAWPDGRRRLLSINGAPLFAPDGSISSLVFSVADITDSIEAERSVRDSREELRSVLETVPDFIVRVGADRRITFVNRTHPGMTMEQVVGTDVLDWVMPNSRASIQAAMLVAMRERRRIEVESTGIGAHGEPLHFLSRIGPVMREDGGIDLIIVGTDISARIAAEQGRRESDARLRSAAESLPFSFWVRDADGRMVVQNERSRRKWGDQLGRLISDMPLPPDLLALAEKNIRRAMAGEIVQLDITHQVAGELRFYHLIIAPVRDGGGIRGVLGVDIDVTDQRRLEEQLAQAAKIESIGRLAGGVAHDFNNLLTAILGFADLARQQLGPRHAAVHSVARIFDAAQRGAALTQQLLGFARKQVIQPRRCQANELVQRAVEMLPRLLGEDIQIILDLTRDPVVIEVDPHQFDQVLINLAINARDAMPTGGRLTIATRLITPSAEELRELPPGPAVAITVSDTGAGMPPEVIARLFEPFFTTKSIGQGTGLGLATCDGIVRQNHGRITVQSEPGRGSCFRIVLPSAGQDADPAPTTARHAQAEHGQETILVVEDEELIRSMLGQMLTDLGYAVLTAADGIAALELASRHPGRIHLLFTDVVMPRLGGVETAERLVALRPDVRVLFASGYTEQAVVQQGQLAHGATYIAKPYTFDSLATKIRQALR